MTLENDREGGGEGGSPKTNIYIKFNKKNIRHFFGNESEENVLSGE